MAIPAALPELERLTFEAFRATARDHDDLRLVPGTQFHGQGEDFPDPVPGRTYAGTNLCMSRQPDGSWSVEWGRASWEAGLPVAEADLYGIYVSEIAADRVRAYLRDAMPANETLGPETASLEQLTSVYTGWLLLEGLDLGCAQEALVCCDGLTDGQRTWLTRFCERWDAQARAEDEARRLGDEPAAPDKGDAIASRMDEAQAADTTHPRYEEWRAEVAGGRTLLGLGHWLRTRG